MRLIAKILIFVLLYNFSNANDSSKINPYRLSLVLGVTAGALTVAHFQQYSSWWKGELTSFHFKDDINQVLNADKFGHAYFSFVLSDLLGRSLHWAGVEKSRALLWGGISTLLFQTYVEIEDGFRPKLGFSVSDEISNIIGAITPYAKEKSQLLKFVSFKISMFPSEKFKSRAHRFIIDDYESLYFWLSFDISGILKIETLKPWFIDFFDISIGYSVKKIDWNRGGEREIFLALDYDFTKLPISTSFLRQIFYLLNYYHLPAPSIRIIPGLKFYWIKF